MPSRTPAAGARTEVDKRVSGEEPIDAPAREPPGARMIVGAASGRFGSGSGCRARVDRPPGPLRGERHVDVTDAELLERAHDRVDERRRRAAAAGLFSFPAFSHGRPARWNVRAPGGPLWSCRALGRLHRTGARHDASARSPRPRIIGPGE